MTPIFKATKLLGYLKRLWYRRFEFVVVSTEGGRTRSLELQAGHLLVAAVLICAVLLVIIGGWFLAFPRLANYAELQQEKEHLQRYRDKVRYAVMNVEQYGLLGADLLRQLEMAIDLRNVDGQPVSSLEERQGGIIIDEIYINFLENVPTFPPVNGYVTRGLMLHDLDLQINHEGIDIAAPQGDLVRAAASGLVVFSGWTEDMGYMVILDHGDGYITVYGHNELNLVAPREWVDRGQPIGMVGNTGISQGPHLHFEIWKDARSIDPRLLINLYREQDVSVETHG